jgi:hypothetical protein
MGFSFERFRFAPGRSGGKVIFERSLGEFVPSPV